MTTTSDQRTGRQQYGVMAPVLEDPVALLSRAGAARMVAAIPGARLVVRYELRQPGTPRYYRARKSGGAQLCVWGDWEDCPGDPPFSMFAD